MAVIFNEKPDSQVTTHSKIKGLSGFVIRLGLAKNKDRAQFVLLIFAIFAVAITLYILIQVGETPVPLTRPSAT